MPTPYHIIQKHVFDVGYSNEKKAFELQNRFSRLFHNEATRVLEEVFDRLIPEGLALRLDMLTLDLGKIRVDQLEKEFPKRFKEALEKELERALHEFLRGNTAAGNKSLTDLLEYFLTTGSLPWWAAGELLLNPAGVVERLIRDDPSKLKGILLQTGQQDYVRKRLAFQFPVATIRSLVEVLEPDEAAFIFGYHAGIIHIQETEQIFRQPVGEFETNLWLFIFTYLLVDRGSNFNRKIFVKSTLGQMARQYNLEYGALLTLLYRALETANPGLVKRSQLSGIIHTLFYEESYRLEKHLPQSAAGMIAEKINRIRRYLLHGNLTGQAVLYSTSALSLLFAELTEQAPELVYDMIRSMSDQEGIWARIVYTFDEETLQKLVRLREPDESEFIFHYAKKLEFLQRQKTLVKTDSSGFHQSVWELILAFLWIERGNVFNTRAFLEYNIRRIARRHHLSYRELLAFLVQGIGQDIRSDRDTSLFHSLAVLLKVSEETESLPNPVVTSSADECLAALNYFLVHQKWPEKWKPFGSMSEDNLLQQILQFLFRESPLALVRLLLAESRDRGYPTVHGSARSMVQQKIRFLFGSTAQARYRVTHILRAAGEEPLRLLTEYMGDEALPLVKEILVKESPPPLVKAAPEAPPAPGIGAGPVYIRNAGLVLLHPLLSHFLDRLGLTEKNQFIDEAARHRSAHLFQFLVDGREEHPEQELVFNKILCAIPPEETLPLHITVTEAEKAMAVELMAVLRQRWEKMQNTSLEGFQVSFLQRDGSLVPVEDGWKLRVEQKGIDVLLQYLPWSWGMIRLPWMNTTLYTEWT